jgi:signal transduction histidine kinase
MICASGCFHAVSAPFKVQSPGPTLHPKLARLPLRSVNDILLNFVMRPVLRVRAKAPYAARQLPDEPALAERERIARELHDSLLQGVQAVSLRLNVWARDARLPLDCRAEIDALARQTRGIVVEGRDRILSLREGCEPVDFLADMDDQAQLIAQEHRQRLLLKTSGRERPLSPRAGPDIMAIVREALVNAFNHSNGEHVMLSIDYGRRAFSVSVLDDGVGIAPGALVLGRRPAHFGLVGMTERTRTLGGKLTIRRLWRRGTSVLLRMPASLAYAMN